MIDLIIDPEFKALIPPLTTEEYNGLEKLIVSEGCRDPIVTWNGIIIDGHNRYSICSKHNLSFNNKSIDFASREDVIDWMYSTQLSRRNLTDESRTYLIGQQYLARKKREGKHIILPQNEGVKTETAEKIASEQKVSRATVERAAEYARAVNTLSSNVGMEFLKTKILQGEVKSAKKDIVELAKQTVEDQVKVIAKMEDDPKRELKEIIRENNIVNRNNNLISQTIPNNKFDVIIADPPWKYDFQKDSSDKIENHYPTMDILDIKLMECPAEKNAVLFLWATAPKLLEALEVMKSWGFTYKTNAVWDKEWIGMGYWFRGQHELLLVGVKGSFSPPSQELRKSSVIRSKRREHSQKPDCVYEMIIEMFPYARRFDMFARNEREGYTTWGNEIGTS